MSRLVEGEGFEPSKAEPSDLQSDPFDRSGTPPNETAYCECFESVKSTCILGFLQKHRKELSMSPPGVSCRTVATIAPLKCWRYISKWPCQFRDDMSQVNMSQYESR